MAFEEQLLHSQNVSNAMQWLYISIKCGKTGGQNEIKMLLPLN